MGKNCQLVGWGGYTSVKWWIEGTKTISDFFIFYEKISHAKKAQKAKKHKQVTFLPLDVFSVLKKCCFFVFCFLVFIFFARNLFVKKQIKKSEIALIPSIHLTTYFNLFAFFSFLKNKFCTVQPSCIKKLNLSSETRELNWNFCSVRTQI